MEKNQKKAIAFIVGFLVLALVAWWILWNGKEVGTKVHIYQDGKEIKVISLDLVTKKEQFTVYGKQGGYNVIEVENGKISIVKASCPDKICIETGCIQDDLVPIVCLPNKLMIKIEGEKENTMDAITR